MTSNNLNNILFLLICGAQCCLGVSIISKTAWNAAPAAREIFLANGLSYVIIHHTAGTYCNTKENCKQELKNIQRYHQKILAWDDIGYNFLIGGDGNIYEGRGWNVLGAHAINWNSRSIGICFMGNYNNDQPTAAQTTAAKELLTDAVAKGQIVSNYILKGHRQVRATECPGNHLFNEIKTWPHWKP